MWSLCHSRLKQFIIIDAWLQKVFGECWVGTTSKSLILSWVWVFFFKVCRPSGPAHHPLQLQPHLPLHHPLQHQHHPPVPPRSIWWKLGQKNISRRFCSIFADASGGCKHPRISWFVVDANRWEPEESWTSPWMVEIQRWWRRPWRLHSSPDWNYFPCHYFV